MFIPLRSVCRMFDDDSNENDKCFTFNSVWYMLKISQPIEIDYINVNISNDSWYNFIFPLPRPHRMCFSFKLNVIRIACIWGRFSTLSPHEMSQPKYMQTHTHLSHFTEISHTISWMFHCITSGQMLYGRYKWRQERWKCKNSVALNRIFCNDMNKRPRKKPNRTQN